MKEFDEREIKHGKAVYFAFAPEYRYNWYPSLEKLS